jgi:hypothetical protein
MVSESEASGSFEPTGDDDEFLVLAGRCAVSVAVGFVEQGGRRSAVVEVEATITDVNDSAVQELPAIA